MRLDKFLSNNGYSRSEAVKLILNGFVFVNDIKIIKKDEKIDENKDIIKVNDKEIVYSQNHYYILNKPAGVITANFDKTEKTVFDILPNEIKKLKLFAVGRLDKETEGLLLLTDDGDLCHKLTSPKYEKEKEYYFELANILSNENMHKIENGLTLKNGETTKPCKIKMITEQTGIIAITEGKYHQVRRMFASVGNKVIYLRRDSENGILLPKELRLGDIKKLSKEQIEILKQ